MANEGRCNDEDHSSARLLGSVAKVLPSHDLVVKRLACTLLTRWPEVGLLVYNTLLKDCADANPLIRSLALRTIMHRNFVAFREPKSESDLLIRGLDDTNAHVRRTGVLGCLDSICVADQSSTATRISTRSTYGDYFIDRLYGMLRDPDPLVVVNCLSALDKLLYAEGGVVINRGIVRHLLSRMKQLSDFGVIQVLNVLYRRYAPESDEDKFSLMNFLDPLLRRQNSAVVYEATSLFLRLVGDDVSMRRQVFRRIAPCVSEFLVDANNAEVQCLWLQFVRDNHDFFEGHFTSLHCEYADPVCIKVLKIEIITLLSKDSDAELVLEELFAHCTDRSDIVSESAVRAIGRSAVRTPRVANICTDTLLQLLALDREATTTASLLVLCQMDISNYMEHHGGDDHRLSASKLLETVLRRSLASDQVMSALVRFLGAHGHLLEYGPYLLEELMSESHVYSDGVKDALLMSGLRMLLERPAEMQMLFGRYAEQCYATGSGELAERVRFYFRLLRSDFELTKRIVCSNG